MKKLAFALLAVLMLMLPVTASANMAEGPRLVLIVLGGPKDLQITLAGEEGSAPLEGVPVGFETHFVLEYLHRQVGPETALEVRGTGVEWDIPMEKINQAGYNSLVTLDVKNHLVISGQPPWRQPLLIGIRVVFTLLVEGAVFYLFGYREKFSWLLFAVTNVVTQTGLNILIAKAEYGLLYGFGLLVYFVAEPLIFLAEALVFAILLWEKSSKRNAACALTANAASLLLGLLLFAFLPI